MQSARERKMHGSNVRRIERVRGRHVCRSTEHIKQTFSKAATVYSNNSKINNYEQNYCIICGKRLQRETDRESKHTVESVETSNNLTV
jgi:hypothetical protein